MPDQCAAIGVQELLVFDPRRAGPKVLGGPPLIQVWRRTAGAFERVASGDGPYPSEVLGAYFTPVEEGRHLRITDDPDGRHPWPTAEEAERAGKESALARIAELEQALRARGSD